MFFEIFCELFRDMVGEVDAALSRRPGRLR